MDAGYERLIGASCSQKSNTSSQLLIKTVVSLDIGRKLNETKAFIEPSTASPASIYLFKVNNRNTRANMFKVNNKDTRTTPMTLFWCLYC